MRRSVSTTAGEERRPQLSPRRDELQSLDSNVLSQKLLLTRTKMDGEQRLYQSI